MKKILSILILAICTYAVAFAVPAHPRKYIYRQPDGTVLTLQNHGDEYFHWTTDQNGHIVEKGSDGFYRRVTATAHEARRAKGLRARENAMRRAAWVSYEDQRVTNFGDRKILCLIANFTDSTFVIENPRQSFHNMLNQEGYSRNGAIGSVRDYYIDNSHNQYRPSFDVYGPVTLTHTSAYYDTTGVHLAIREAYDLLASQINIADYDTDNDGAIDMVLFYYPGRNEAEGAGKESIWPHQSTGYFGTLGGKTFNRYFCTSELYNIPGTTTMCNIGTTCHEFAHSLGLPDTYDTDYEKNGQNSLPGYFDLMCGGNYNDEGRRPPYLNAVELNMLGWMDYPQELGAGSYTLEPVYNYSAYQSRAASDGEYFVFELRDNTKWDSALSQTGMLVHHIDKSSRMVGGGMSAAQIWNTNKINAYGGHPCIYPLSSGNNLYTYPGSNNVTDLLLTDWDGNETGVLLSNIVYNGTQLTFSTAFASGRRIYGNVYNAFGQPLDGAEVVLSQSAYSFVAAPYLLQGDVVAQTDEHGYYELELPDTAGSDQILTVRFDGYIPVSMNLPVSGAFNRQNFYLPRIGEGMNATLQRYNPANSLYTIGLGESSSLAAAIRYTAEELAAMGAINSTLKTVTFRQKQDSYDKVYIVIDLAGSRALLKDVTDIYQPGAEITSDISDAGIVIPDSGDLYIGIGFTGIPSGSHPFYAYTNEEFNHVYRNSSFLSSSTWGTVSFGSGNKFSLLLSAELTFHADPALSNYGVAFIKLENGVPAAVAPDTKTLYSEEWFLDGAPVTAPQALSSHAAGAHTYMVKLKYYDGTTERVYYDFSN